jgi:5-formyltetrahydrofolate cyclo-ligase
MGRSMRDKHALRQALAEHRAAAFEACHGASAPLAAHFPDAIAITSTTIVAGYMPFRTEIDVLPLMRALMARGGQGAMPRINSPSPLYSDTVSTPYPPTPSPRGGRGDALTFHLCDPDNPAHFAANKWGLLEPHAHLPTVTPTILLVPLLGFDRHGNRIGYGKGYYDGAIASLRAHTEVIAIGVAFAAQEVDRVPTQPHDQRLDWIITENEAYRFPS